jgi:hypothetical protein
VDQHHACLTAKLERGIRPRYPNRARELTCRHRRGRHFRRALHRLLDGFEPLLNRRRGGRCCRLLFELGHGVGRPERQRAHLIDPLAERRELPVLRLQQHGLPIDQGTLFVEQPAHVIERRGRCGLRCGLRVSCRRERNRQGECGENSARATG